MIIKPTTPKIYTPQDGSCVLNMDGRDVRGSKIYDRSGKGNHGTIIGAVLKPMNYGLPVLKFDGVDDYVDAGFRIDTSQNATIAGWAKVPDKVNDRNFAGCSFAENGFNIGLASNIYFFSWAGADKYTVAANAINIDTWFHWALVAKDGTAYYYVNTVVVDSISYTGGGYITPDTRTILIGARRDNVSPYNPLQFLNGSLADVRIYNRALSASEISKMFNDLRHIYGI